MCYNDKFTFLFDGELYKEEGEYIYSIFDCLVYESTLYTSLDLQRRLSRGKKFVDHDLPKNLTYPENCKFPKIKCVLKTILKSYNIEYVINSIKTLKHDNDGLIFTPVEEPYKIQERSSILKWKPLSLLTLDFIISETPFKHFYKLSCHLDIEQSKNIDKKINVINKSTKIFVDYFFDVNFKFDSKNTIGEFVWDSEREVVNLEDFSISKGGWKFLKYRVDKPEPNNIKIVIDTVNSLSDAITQENLIKKQNHIRDSYQRRNK